MGVKEIERRVQSLFGVLVAPVNEDDYAEKGRRAELRTFVLSHLIYVGSLILLSGSLKELLQSLSRSLNNMHLLGSYAILTMPKP